METTIRPARATDAAECGRIIYAAFTDIARNWPGCGVRTSNCGWSATFSLRAAAWFARETGAIPPGSSNS